MKTPVIVLLLATASLFGQSKDATPAKPATRPLTTEQAKDLLLIDKDEEKVVEAINVVAKIALAPVQAQKSAVYAAICSSAGIPLAECEIDRGKNEVRPKAVAK